MDILLAAAPTLLAPLWAKLSMITWDDEGVVVVSEGVVDSSEVLRTDDTVDSVSLVISDDDEDDNG